MCKTFEVYHSEDYQQNILSALHPDCLELILMPTEKCNFRCVYCYEDFEAGRFSHETIEAIKRLILARAEAGLQSLRIGFFGGEPILEHFIMEDLLSYCKNISVLHDFFFYASSSTNFYLMDEEKLISFSQRGLSAYQVTLDGDKDYHNTKRFIHHKDGSFDKIWKNLISYNEFRLADKISEGRITIRLHLHTDNQDSLTSLLYKISSHFDPRFFQVHFKPIGHYGGKNDKNFEIIGERSEVFKVRVKALRSILQNFMAPEFDKNLSEDFCYAAKPNSFIIRSNGDLAKCTLALNDACNNVGKINHDGTFSFKSETLTPWMEAFKTLDPGTLACPFSFVQKYSK